MALYTDLGREDLLDIDRRADYIEDNHGICMCYKHRRIWREGADFKLGRRPRTGPGGACKECCLKAEI